MGQGELTHTCGWRCSAGRRPLGVTHSSRSPRMRATVHDLDAINDRSGSLEGVAADDADELDVYDASLRVFSETLRESDLVAALGTPTKSHDVGSLVSPRSQTRRKQQWLDTAQHRLQTTQPLDEQIEELVQAAEAHSVAFEGLRPTCDIDLFCGVGQRTINAGFQLRPDLTRRIAALELTITVDVY